MKVYYSHCQSIYHTPQEHRDLVTLHRLGLEPYNPNNADVAADVSALKDAGDVNYMEYFKNLVAQCPIFAFRALPDGRIPAGVAKELAWAREMDKPIIELPSNITGRVISVENTREYLHEVGQR